MYLHSGTINVCSTLGLAFGLLPIVVIEGTKSLRRETCCSKRNPIAATFSLSMRQASEIVVSSTISSVALGRLTDVGGKYQLWW